MYLFTFKRSSDQYVLFCHDPLPHLAIDASLMHEGADESSLRKICKYQQKVPQHYYLFDILVLVDTLKDYSTKLSILCIFKPKYKNNFQF